MSPRIALTTACSDSPSKLNVAAPEDPPRLGGGALAAAWLMTWPVPRRICGCRPASDASGSTAPAPMTTVAPPSATIASVPAVRICTPAAPWRAGSTSPSRRTVGTGVLAQPASNATSRPATTGRKDDRGDTPGEALRGDRGCTGGNGFMRCTLRAHGRWLRAGGRRRIGHGRGLAAQAGAAGLDPLTDRIHPGLVGGRYRVGRPGLDPGVGVGLGIHRVAGARRRGG